MKRPEDFRDEGLLEGEGPWLCLNCTDPLLNGFLRN